MAADRPAGGGDCLAEHSADPYRVHSAAGAAAVYVLTKLQLDRRLIACVMTFGLITPYMFLPVGFGNIFLNEILLANVARSGVDISGINVTHAMGIPALGMVVGLRWRLSAIARSASTTCENRAGRAGGGAVQPAEPDGGRCGDCRGVHCAAAAGLDDHRRAGRFPDLLGVRHRQVARHR
jgi:hypothetical protein